MKERPDQSPETFRKFFEEQGFIANDSTIFGSIYAAMRRPYPPPSEQQVMAAAALLLEMVKAAKYGKNWNPNKKRIGVRKDTEKRFDLGLVTVDDEAFGLVLAYVRGEFTHGETGALFNEHVCTASVRQIEEWIAAIKPRAEKMAALFPLPQRFGHKSVR